MALLDFDRAIAFSKKRKSLANLFYSVLALNSNNFEAPVAAFAQDVVPLALPIVVRQDANRPDLMNKIKGYLEARGVMTRPLIAGWLGAHTAFKKYDMDPKDFPRSVWLNDNAIYLGLHHKVTSDMVVKIAQEISKL